MKTDIHTVRRRFLALWVTSYQCTLRCPYCINKLNHCIVEEQFRGMPDPLDTENWVHIWNTYAPHTMIISGGEPFLVPNFVEVLAGINPQIAVSINTNLTQDVTELMACVNPRHNFDLTTTYHFDKKQANFFDNLRLLKRRGFRCNVTFVAYPQYLKFYEEYKAKVNEIGLPLRVIPCVSINNDISYTPEQEAFANEICPDNRSHWVGRHMVDRDCMCSGGYNHICVIPNGDVYKCTSKAMCQQGQEIIGNILTDANILAEVEMSKCTYGRCCPSDEDHIKIVPLSQEAT